jgi:hypothetical protein
MQKLEALLQRGDTISKALIERERKREKKGKQERGTEADVRRFSSPSARS